MTKIHRILLAVFVFLSALNYSNAQTVLIDPANEGGFELPGGFVGNGWTVANNATGNQWVIGTVPTGFTNNSAFISNDAGVTHAFTNNAPTVVHFYRDVTIPAGETSVTLSFNWVALGEFSFFDGLMVSIAPTTFTPAATTTNLGTAFLAGVTEVGRFWNQATPQTVTVSLPQSAINNCSAPVTIRIIFSWKNDTSGGTNPPAAVDNISMVSTAPSPASNIGTYTIDNTLPTAGTNFNSFNEAIAWLNAVCIENPIVFNVTAGQTFVEVPRVITATGTAVNTITFQKSGSGTNPIILGTNGVGTVDAGITISGGDYFTFDGISIANNPANATTTAQIEYGYLLRNASATNGAQFNTIINATIGLTRGYTTARAILQSTTTTGGGVTPTAATGANSQNLYNNITVDTSFAGIYLLGTAAFPDINSRVTNSNIGNSSNISIGSTAVSTATYGIRADNQSAFTISGNNIQNVVTGTQCEGINIIAFQGTCSVNNNRIRGIRNSGTASTTVISGIRATHTTTGTHALRIYNNSISNITSGYTGAASGTRVLRGINISGTGGTATQSYVILNNSVSIDGSTSLNISSSCMEIATTSGPVFTVANNIFANFTGTQTGLARHYVYVSTSATSLGNTGTSVNNNVYFVLNDVGTTGFIGLGAAVTYAAITNWRTAYAGQDIASVSLNPNYIDNAQDLHSTNVALNGIGQAHPAYLTTDLDNAARTDFDPGAYIIDGCSGTPTAGIINGAGSVCLGKGTNLTLSGASSNAGTSYQWGFSTTPGGPYTNLGTTNLQATGPLTVPTYYAVTVTCSLSGLSAVTSEKAVLIDTLPVISVTPAIAANCLPSGTSDLTASGSSISYTWSPAAGLSATTGATVTASPTLTTVYTVVGTEVNGCTASTTATVNAFATPVINNVTATPSDVCIGGSSQLNVVAVVNGAYTVDPITFGSIATPGTGVTALSNAGTALVTLSSGTLDDGGWADQILPFTFSFYGVNYNSIAISTNGFIYLGAGAPNTYTGYNNAFPSTLSARPSIGATYSDLDFRTIGSINYFTVGTAPNRQFVINWTGGNFFSATGAITTQIILYETTNIIEVHTTNSSGTNNAVQGIQNPAGTAATTVTGRNRALWAVSTPDAYRFNPPTLTYSWSPSASLNNSTLANPVASNINAATVYNVTATSNGCDASSAVTITAGLPLSAAAATSTPVACAATNVTLEASPIGGGGPYFYNWDGPLAFTSNIQNPVLASSTAAMSGLYNVTITDNCGATATASVNITVNALPSVSVVASNNTFCTPGGTAVTLTASGASSFAWSPSAGLSTTTGSTVSATPTTTTTYNVVGTDSLTGCTISIPSVITASPFVSMNSVDATFDTVCIGGSTVLSANAGVTLNYCASTHASGCSGDDITNVTLGSINNPTTGCGGPTRQSFFPAGPTTTTTLSVSGGTYTLSVSFGTDANQYFGAWIDFNQNGIFEVSEFLGASANAGASGTTSITFTVPAGAANGITRLRIVGGNDLAVASNQACGASSSPWGETQDYPVTITGGFDSYSYTWSPSSFLNVTNSASVTASAVNAATTYNVTATSNGCSASGTISIAVNNPSTSATANAATCLASDGSVTVSSTNGVAPYSFVWSNGSTSATVSALAAGSYSVSSTDALGCQSTANVNVSTNNVALNNTSNTTATTCLATDGTATVSTSNGLSPFSYLWSNGQTTATASGLAAASYTVTVTDANGCVGSSTATVTTGSGNLGSTITTVAASCIAANGSATLVIAGGTAPFSVLWSNGATGITASGLTAGTYSATVTDANGCVSSATNLVNANQGTLSTTATAVNSTCTAADGAVSVNIAGGTAPFSTLWSNGATATNVNGLAAGTYSVTVTDANGCARTSSATVSASSGTLAVSAASVNTICTANNGTATATITGGTAPFTTSWSNGATATSLSGLTAGTYTVTVTDASGCINTSSTSVAVNSGNLVGTVSTTATTCQASNGTATATNTGGTAPFTYQWAGGQTTSSLSGLAGGTVVVTITDANGCQSLATSNVQINSGNLAATASSTNSTCSAADGTATVTTTGGTAPFSFVWNNGQTNATAIGLASGTYAVTVLDANGCGALANTTVAAGSGSLTASAASTNATCLATDGTATATANGGTAPFSFVWNNGQTAASISALAAGSYTVTVTDANGCASTANATVGTSNGGLTASATATNANCTTANGTATVTASGGTAPYNFVWNNGQTGATANNLAAGAYAVTVIDANGCASTANATVGTNSGNLAATSTTTDVTTFGGNNGAVNLTVSGGTAPFSFVWSNGATTEDLNGLVAGSYTVTVTDANGCATTQTATVNQPPVSIALTANNWTAAIFPNPSETQTMVSVELGTVANVRIRLINSLGQIIQSAEYSDVMNVQHSLNVSELPAAIYMVEITANGIQKTQRLVVTRK